MKIRQGFVSNSSSSSFLVIDAKNGYESIDDKNLVVDDSFGETEFGWGPETISDIGSKIIFAFIQTQYLCEKMEPLLELALIATKGTSNKWLTMLEEVIKENSNVETIEWRITCDLDSDSNKDWGYIDHQSCASEDANIEIFDNKQILKDFIFGKDSKIQLRSDYEEYNEEEDYEN